MFDIHPDIAHAWTPPASYYTSPEAYDLTRRRVLARSWQLIADTDQVKVPGAVYPVTLLEGCLDEPILLTRDADDRLHCLSNVCTHRGTILCEHPGREKSLVCRYHGRRFDLDGSFRHMPEFDRVAAFPSQKDNLSPIRFHTLGKFIFASPDPAFSFQDLTQQITSRVGFLPWNDAVLHPTRSKDYLVRAHWALYCDNYLEGFHIPFVHPSLNKVLDYASYTTELYPYSSLQLGLASPTGADQTFPNIPASSPDAAKPVAAYYYWLFPNTMLNIYPWGISVNIVRPLGPELTRVSFLTYVWDESRLDAGAGAGLDRVEREDESVVEAVQRGMKGRHYQRGRYSPTRETGTHHFHRLLARLLT